MEYWEKGSGVVEALTTSLNFTPSWLPRLFSKRLRHIRTKKPSVQYVLMVQFYLAGGRKPFIAFSAYRISHRIAEDLAATQV